ncbi:hypothetical protein ANRL4_03077 [Anaerolineae bacterium]|nr:hypothetical protein ANRL4_03077 [Anaerolineae bacterium]
MGMIYSLPAGAGAGVGAGDACHIELTPPTILIHRLSILERRLNHLMPPVCMSVRSMMVKNIGMAWVVTTRYIDSAQIMQVEYILRV